MPLYLSPKDGWEYIFDVLKEFPALTAIITNYGLWGSDRYFFPLVKAYKNVYIDTSDYQVLSGLKTFVSKFASKECCSVRNSYGQLWRTKTALPVSK